METKMEMIKGGADEKEAEISPANSDMVNDSDIDPITHLSFSNLKKLLTESWHAVESARAHDLILVVGETGAGKSTTINYLMGSRLEKDEKGRLRVAGGEKEYAKVGHGKADSETWHSQVIPCNHLTLSGAAFCDCPGFDDTRINKEIGVCANLGVPLAIKSAQKIRRVLVVVNYKSFASDRGKNLKALITTLGGLLKNPTNIESNIIWIFTHVPKKETEQDILSSLEEHLQSNNNDLTDLLSRFFTNLNDRISVEKFLNEMIKTSDEKQLDILQQALHGLAVRYHLSGEKEAELIKYRQSSQILTLAINACRRNDVYIIRGNNQPDDRLPLIKKLSDRISIDKNQFIFMLNKNQNTALFTMIDRIASHGMNLIEEWQTLTKNIEECKNSILDNQNEIISYQAKIERNSILQGDTYIEKNIADFKEKIGKNEIKLQQLNTQKQSKQSIKDNLSVQLNEIDIDTPEVGWEDKESQVIDTGVIIKDVAEAALVGAQTYNPYVLIMTTSAGIIKGAFSSREKIFKYTGTPYHSVQVEPESLLSSKVFSVKRNEPENGQYEATYAFRNIQQGNASVKILFRRKDLPKYKSRIESLKREIVTVEMEMKYLEENREIHMQQDASFNSSIDQLIKSRDASLEEQRKVKKAVEIELTEQLNKCKENKLQFENELNKAEIRLNTNKEAIQKNLEGFRLAREMDSLINFDSLEVREFLELFKRYGKQFLGEHDNKYIVDDKWYQEEENLNTCKMSI